MHRLIIALLRAGVLVAVLVGLYGQVLVVPTTAAHQADLFPPYARLVVPCVTVAVLGIACVQVVLGAGWMLLAMAGRGVLFTQPAFRWVDTIILTSIAATLLAFGSAVYLVVTPVPAPGDGMGLIGATAAVLACVAAGVSFTMLMVVMRGLLRKATDLQTQAAGTA